MDSNSNLHSHLSLSHFPLLLLSLIYTFIFLYFYISSSSSFIKPSTQGFQLFLFLFPFFPIVSSFSISAFFAFAFNLFRENRIPNPITFPPPPPKKEQLASSTDIKCGWIYLAFNTITFTTRRSRDYIELATSFRLIIVQIGDWKIKQA